MEDNMNSWDRELEKLEKLSPNSEKTKLIEEMFHSSIWNHLNSEQKIKLMELLEIDLSYQDNREPNKLQVWLKLPSRASAAFPASNAIRISKHHLENIGIGSNVLFYCAVVHEHEHFNQYYDSISDKKDSLTEEMRDNLKSLITYCNKMATQYIEYRFQPTEYYAHKNSEVRTRKVFERLTQDLGPDEGFEKWKREECIPTDFLVQLYNEENGTSFSFEELYNKILEKIKGKKFQK